MQRIIALISRTAFCWIGLLASGASPGMPQGSSSGERIAGENQPHAAVFRHAAVAADHATASAAGAEILRHGGNAVDAAVAVGFTLAVVRPDSCGIGGGGFMIIHLKNDSRHGTLTTAINYRETCPAGIDGDYYTRPENNHPDAPTRGGKAVATPGTVAGLLYALEKYGTMDLPTVMAPAIRAAREGFLADRHMVSAAREAARWIADDRAGRTARFGYTWQRLCAEGSLSEGDRIVLPELARTLELISSRGAATFYFGEVAQAIVSSVQADAGPMTLADLAAYRVDETQPLSATFAGRRLYAMPPPSSGGLAIAQTLEILDRAAPDLASMSPRDPLAMHLTVEALKHAFADRARWLGDPAFVVIPVHRLLSEEYLSRLAGSISREHTIPLDRYGSWPEPAADFPHDGGTSHFSVVDAFGNAVSCTETINLGFGSMLAVEGMGFILNNQMDDFLTRPGEPNAFGLTQSDRNLPAPGKRPLSSMSPTLAIDSASGDVELAIGASGGPRIITATLQTVLNTLARGMSAEAAAREPRLHTQWSPDILWLERDLATPDVVAALARFGHTTSDRAPSAACQFILRRPGGLEAACDPRKGGSPAGY